MNRVLTLLASSLLVTACAGRGDYKTYYLAEQGDYDGALEAARSAQGRGIDGVLFGTGASRCRDYAGVVTVLVAKSDFDGAGRACADYDERCAVIPDSKLCFYYQLSELESASGDSTLADELVEEARQNLHFRWLMIRDDYENRPLKRPIY